MKSTEDIKVNFIGKQMSFLRNGDDPTSDDVVPVEIADSLGDGTVEIAFNTHNGKKREYLRFDRRDFIKALKAFDA